MCTDLSPPRGRHRWSVSTARSTSPRSADTRSRATWPRFTAQRCTGLVAANSVQARRPRRRLQPSQLGTHQSRPGRHRPAVSDGAQRDASQGPALRPRRACPLRAQARHRDRRHQPSPRSTGRRRVECDEFGETPPLLASRPGPRGRRVGESSTGRFLLTACLERLAATKRISTVTAITRHTSREPPSVSGEGQDQEDHTWCIAGAAQIRGDTFMNVTPHAQGMRNRGSSEYPRSSVKREHRRHQQRERSSSQQQPPLGGATAEDSASAGPRRAAATTCGWCHGAITPRSRGPIPKWCSATCRHRSWEQVRAAASGRSAVEVVERVVTVPATPPASAPRPRQLTWVDLLRQLSAHVEQGRVYDGHLAAIAAALDDVMLAVHRRGSTALHSSSRWLRG
jgi:cytochrome c553